MTDWLNSRNAPDADNLRRISGATGASVDWLLGIEGAPQFRGQTREPVSLEGDVAAYIRREIAKHGRTAPWKSYLDALSVDGAEVLDAAAGAAIDRIEEMWDRAASTSSASESLGSALDSLHLADRGSAGKVRVIKDKDRDLSPVRPSDRARRLALDGWLATIKEKEFKRLLGLGE